MCLCSVSQNVPHSYTLAQILRKATAGSPTMGWCIGRRCSGAFEVLAGCSEGELIDFFCPAVLLQWRIRCRILNASHYMTLEGVMPRSGLPYCDPALACVLLHPCAHRTFSLRVPHWPSSLPPGNGGAGPVAFAVHSPCVGSLRFVAGSGHIP